MAAAVAPSDSFSVLILNKDKICVVDAQQEIIQFFENFIIRNWSYGLQKHTEEYGCSHIFKLVTNPFSWHADAETKLITNRFMRLLVDELSRKNWHLILCSSKVAKSADPKYPGDIHVAWFFRYFQSEPSKDELVCLSLASSDRLQLVNGSDNLNRIVRMTIEPWIQKEEPLDNDFIYKIRGNPWSSNDFSETIRASRILVEILKKFHKNCYRLKYQGNIRCLNQCFYFQRETSNMDQEELELMVLAFTSSDKIRIVDPPRDGDIVQKVKEYIMNFWKKGIQEILPDEIDDSQSIEFKLNGNPWMTDSEHQSYDGRHLICKLLEMLLGCGWAVFRAFDIQSPSLDKKTKSIIVLQKCAPVQMRHVCLQFWGKETIRIMDGTEELTQTIREIVHSHWSLNLKQEIRANSNMDEPPPSYDEVMAAESKH